MRSRSVLLDAALGAAVVAGSALVGWRVQHGQSDVVTGAQFVFSCGAAMALLLRAGARLAGRPQRLQDLTLLAAALTVSLLGADAVLRYGVRTRLTYGETNGSAVYRSVYRYDNPSWYHTFGRNRTVRDVKPEYTQERRTNSLGLPEREVPVDTPADEYRVLALGDSFTEGAGAAYEETWVREFERRTSPLADGRVVRAIAAGVSGSDPLLELALFRDRLAVFRPRLVIVAVNNSDITDVVTRGGRERFRADGTIHGQRGPWWDWLYGISFITRHVVHDLLGRSWLLVTPQDLAVAQQFSRGEIRHAVTEIQRVARDLGAATVLVVHPHQYEVQAGAYEPGFKPLVDTLVASDDPPVIDALARFRARGPITPANSGEYYWTLDYHHNAKGYAALGEVIAAEMHARHLLPEGR